MSTICNKEVSEPGSPEWLDSINKLKNTKEWQKTLLDLLDKDELVENYPSTEGLYRLARLVYGDLNISVTVLKCPQVGDRSSTVHVKVSTTGNCVRSCRSVESAADVYEHNTKSPYNKHAVATAETKAFGRALKKLLGLKIHTHEEMLDDETSYEKLNEQQVRAVENVAKKLNVDLNEFLAEHAGVSIDLFKSGSSGLTKEHGIKLLDKLNQIQNKKV